MVGHFWESAAHGELLEAGRRFAEGGAPHLKELLKDEKRCDGLITAVEGVVMDASRSLVGEHEVELLTQLYAEQGVGNRLKAMFGGELINETEKRAVGHVALRSGAAFVVNGHDFQAEVREVQDRIFRFAEDVHSGKTKGHSGKAFTHVVCIGIGGSYLGVDFIYQALKAHPWPSMPKNHPELRFVANVDPVDVQTAIADLDPETTLTIVVSKTFTTAETMLNAKIVRQWYLNHYGANSQAAIANHICAVSTNISGCNEFGIDAKNVFGFWDWVGGRFSVCSAVGVLPLALRFGKQVVTEFLGGCAAIDQHVLEKADKPWESLPARLALLSFYNASYLNCPSVAVLPYAQALNRFPAHIQQLTMESNGKRVCMDGTALPNERFSGEIYFGEPGTNGQHSFYQLIHQGRVIPCEFIGFTESQRPVTLEGNSISCHDELMCNFFAQPDALALGKSAEQLAAEGCPAALVPHKTFPGNRPSISLLFKGNLTPAAVGKLLAIYEHRVAIEGFLWNVNSFDQWGVELGKVLAKNIRGVMEQSRARAFAHSDSLAYSTNRLLSEYFD